VRFSDDDRVTITDPKDRWYGETGTVDDYYIGMTGRTLYVVKLDVREDPIPFTEDQLDLGDNIYARSE
jgi:hypothetical protein